MNDLHTVNALFAMRQNKGERRRAQGARYTEKPKIPVGADLSVCPVCAQKQPLPGRHRGRPLLFNSRSMAQGVNCSTRKKFAISFFNFFFILLIILFQPLDSLAQPDATAIERAKEILRELDDMWRGNSSYSVFSMKVKTAHYTREMTLEGWSKGKEKSLVRILRPLKEKGTATLKSDSNIYSYLPRTDRTIRLTSGMMMGSWMGSHFTNDDLVKESRMEEDYIPSITYEGERDNRNIIEFTLTPKPDAPVVWGKIVAIILPEDYIPVKYLYYDEDMNIARTFFFDRVEQMAGRPRPRVMKVVPANKTDEYTEITYEKLELETEIEDSFFSIANLKRM